MPLFAIPFPVFDPVLIAIGPLSIRWYALAYIGGLIIGVVEALAGFYLPEGWKDIAAYVVVLAVLLVKPSGIFGETIRKKV